jgi:hypothetical protein
MLLQGREGVREVHDVREVREVRHLHQTARLVGWHWRLTALETGFDQDS